MNNNYDGTITIGAKLEIDKNSIRKQSDSLKKSVEGVLGNSKSSAGSDSFSEIKNSAKDTIVEVDKLSNAINDCSKSELKINIDGKQYIGEIDRMVDTAHSVSNQVQQELGDIKINIPEADNTFSKAIEDIDAIRFKIQELASTETDINKLEQMYYDLSDAVERYYNAMTEATGETKENITLDSGLAEALGTIESRLYNIGSAGSLETLSRLTDGMKDIHFSFENPIETKDVAVVQELDGGFKKLNETVFNTTKQTTNLLGELIKTGKDGSFSVEKMNKSLKKGVGLLLKYGLGIRSAYFLFRKLRSAIGEATKEMASQIPEVNTVLSSLKTSLNQVKGSLGTAFQPILSTVQPILISLMNTLNNVIVTLAKFFAVMRGQNYIYKATAAQVNYAKSLDKANKAQKKQLAGFDELNNISSDSGGGSSSGGTPTADYDKEPIDPKFLTMVEKIKKVLEAILPLVTLIGLAFGAWKLINFINDLLGLHLSLKSMLGIMLIIVGLIFTAYEYSKMWTEGITWGRLTKYLVGIATLLTGLGMVFGKVGVAVGLLVSGFMTLIIAIKDILENGVNAQNSFTALAGIVMVVVGAFLLFGSTVAFIVGIIAGLIVIFAALISWAGNGEEAISLLKNAFGEFGKAIKALVNGDLDQAWAHAKKGIYNLANFFISCAEGIANGFIKMANVVIDAVNNMLPETIPDWVPIIGGNSFPKIPEISKSVSLGRMKIPTLAQGAVLPPNNPFLAIVGDQKSGTNIEAPISTIKEALAEVLSDKMISLLNQQVNLLEDIADKDIIISENDLFKTIRNKSRIYKKSTGVNAFEF